MARPGPPKGPPWWNPATPRAGVRPSIQRLQSQDRVNAMKTCVTESGGFSKRSFFGQAHRVLCKIRTQTQALVKSFQGVIKLRGECALMLWMCVHAVVAQESRGLVLGQHRRTHNSGAATHSN